MGQKRRDLFVSFCFLCISKFLHRKRLAGILRKIQHTGSWVTGHIRSWVNVTNDPFSSYVDDVFFAAFVVFL